MILINDYLAEEVVKNLNSAYSFDNVSNFCNILKEIVKNIDTEANELCNCLTRHLGNKLKLRRNI